MPWSYRVFGVKLEATRPLPGLIARPAASKPDVRIWCARPPSWAHQILERDPRLWYASPSRDERGRPALKVWGDGNGGGFRLQYADGAEFLVDGRGRRVWAKGSENGRREETVSYLLGPVLSLVLRLRGVTCLHASAIAVRNEGIAFLGPAGAGKSTIAAAFAGRGCPVVSDDLVALGDRETAFIVPPGFPWLRLRPASVKALCRAAGVVPPLTPTRDGQYLDLDLTQNGYRIQSAPLPLAAIYLLDGRRAGPAAPCVQALSGGDALISLVANSWATRLLDGAMRAQEFDLLHRVASRIPCRRVRLPADPTRLPALCDAIAEDFRDVAISS